MSAFSGLYVATLTPFDSVGRVDLAVIRKHTEFLIGAGVDGICPCGTTGEWLYLSAGEKVRIIETAVDAAAGRVKVMAGIAAIHSREISLLARAAESAGADAVFLTPPIYYPAPDETVFEHYASVREAGGLPVFAYNIPSHATNTISVSCVERLVTENVITGIKDSTASAQRIGELIERFGKQITVMAASDSFALEGRRLGAHGFISAIANIWPGGFRRLWDGEDVLQSAVDSARQSVKEAGGIPALKHLAGLGGFAFGGSRLPGTEVTESQKHNLATAFREATLKGLS